MGACKTADIFVASFQLHTVILWSSGESRVLWLTSVPTLLSLLLDMTVSHHEIACVALFSAEFLQGNHQGQLVGFWISIPTYHRTSHSDMRSSIHPIDISTNETIKVRKLIGQAAIHTICWPGYVLSVFPLKNMSFWWSTIRPRKKIGQVGKRVIPLDSLFMELRPLYIVEVWMASSPSVAVEVNVNKLVVNNMFQIGLC